MKDLAGPSRAHSDESRPYEREQDGKENNWVCPVGALGRFEGRCWVGGLGNPLVVEAYGH